MKKRLLSKAISLALVLALSVSALSMQALASDTSPNTKPATTATVPADVKPVKTYTIQTGTSYKLPDTLKKTGDSYATSNSSILTVDKTTGKFVGVKNGTAYIIITNSSEKRYIKITVGTTTSTTKTTSALTGYTVNVQDKTTLATTSSSKTYMGTYYFYSANGTVLGSISGETLQKVLTTSNIDGDSGVWLTDEFNKYRGLGTASTTTGITGNGGNTTTNNTDAKTNISSLASLINEQRQKDSLYELTYDSSMQNMADTRAKELATKFSHTRPSGESITEYGYAEIIHSGSSNSSGAFQGYYESTGHRNVMLSERYNNFAVGCYKGDNATYWVVLFSE